MIEAAEVAQHYDNPALVARLETALAAAGLADQVLTPSDLAPLDQFHTRGLAATREMAEAAALKSGDRVLDVGAGLGGPSRYLAATYGCQVTGIDLSPSYVEAAAFLAARSGLGDRVSYRCANALSLPFADAAYDVVWTQHVAMNIADRAGLYAEFHRVLRPYGRLAIYDVVIGDGRPLHFPVPWSRLAQTSALITPDAMRALLEEQGFRVRSWIDRSEAGRTWFAALPRPPAEPPPLGLHLVMGTEFREMAANLGRNLMEGRVGLIEAILERA